MSGCGCGKETLADPRGYAPFVRSVGNVAEGLVCTFADKSGRTIKGEMPLSELVDMIVAVALPQVLDRFGWFAGRVPLVNGDGSATGLYVKLEALDMGGMFALKPPSDPAAGPQG